MDERRKHTRVKATNIAEFEIRPGPGDIKAITRDLSASGAGIYSDIYLPPGSYVKIKLHNEDKRITKDAVVAWTNLTKDNLGPVFQIGLHIPE